jgi:S-formylglutathione hydrolase FrmB
MEELGDVSPRRGRHAVDDAFLGKGVLPVEGLGLGLKSNIVHRPSYIAIVLFVLGWLATPAFAAGRVDCASVKSTAVRSSVAYCALLPPSYDDHKSKRFPVVYMLHGLGDNHQTLINSGTWNLIEQLQAEKKIGEFVIITPNAGRSFYINSKNGRTRYEDFLIREFIPAMEKKYRIGSTRATRAISGISMGGFGALRTAFKYPQMFTSVAVHSAALIERMPKGAESAGLGMFMGTSFGSPFDPEYWRKNTPFVFARNGSLKGLKIYFDCGDRDEYGFDAGTRALHKLLESRKIPHEFHIYPGGHDFRYFAEHLPESFAFQSRALGLTK